MIYSAKDIMQLEIAREQVKNRLAKGDETKRWIDLLIGKIKNATSWKEVSSILWIWSNKIPKEYDYLIYDAIPMELRYE